MFFLSIFFSLFTLTTYLTSRSLELKVTTGDIFQPKVYNLAQLTFFGYNLAGKNVSFFDVLRSALIDYKRLQGIPMTDSACLCGESINILFVKWRSTVNYGKFQWNDVFPSSHENRSNLKFGLLRKYNFVSISTLAQRSNKSFRARNPVTYAG